MLRRLVWGAVPALAVVMLATGCASSGSSCWSTDFEVNGSAAGASTAQGAIDQLVAKQSVKGLPATGWSGPATGGAFTSGDYTLTVSTVQGHTGYFVTKASTCH
jgi:hypothetical protein